MGRQVIETIYLLAHSSNGYNNWIWGSLELGDWTLIHIVQDTEREPIALHNLGYWIQEWSWESI